LRERWQVYPSETTPSSPLTRLSPSSGSRAATSHQGLASRGVRGRKRRRSRDCDACRGAQDTHDHGRACAVPSGPPVPDQPVHVTGAGLHLAIPSEGAHPPRVCIRNGTPQKQQPTGSPQAPRVHIGVYGNTGSGKTTTCVNIAAQAYRNGVIPVINHAGNVSDWRVLRDVFPSSASSLPAAPMSLLSATTCGMSRPVFRLESTSTGWLMSMLATLPNDGVLSMHFDDISTPCTPAAAGPHGPMSGGAPSCSPTSMRPSRRW